MERRAYVVGAVLSLCVPLGGCLSDESTTDERRRNRADTDDGPETGGPETDGEYAQLIHVVNRTEEAWAVSVEIRSDDVVFAESVAVEPGESEAESVTLDAEEDYTIDAERADGETDSHEVRTGDDDHAIEVLLDERRVEIVQLTTD